jgi:2,4-dienoyl-CoA reductase-like NADH-dependent reductase (Old Yellow Enzyme family)/thioredoxin reductase
MKTLQSNFIMAPMKLGYSDGKGNITEKHLDFYRTRNKYIGAIIPEPLYMDAGLRELPTQMGIDDDNKIDGLRKLCSVIKENGAKAIAHLNHPGRMANPKIPNNYFWSSTDKACENGGANPKIMDREMMDAVVKMFVDASKRAVASGFDMIELQLGHGYLLSQFLSPAVNDRTDDYGGSWENRIKFPLEVVAAVRKSVEVPIIVRISGDEIIPNGLHVDDMISLAKHLEKIDVDALHITAGSVCSTPPWFFQHMFIPKGKTWDLAAKIKEQIGIPVIFVGKINSVKDIETIKQKYQGEYIALGRALVADPDFISKYLGKTNRTIRPCLACAEGCLGGVKAGKGLGCVVNPLVNSDLQQIQKTNEIKHYAVVGGGLAGMEASISLSERGHKVDLFEKNSLGGQFNLAFLPPNKESLKSIVEYYKTEIENHDNIKVFFEEATKEKLISGKYEGVIMATGAIPAVPFIQGLKEYYWTEFLDDNQLPHNKKVVVIGGGLIGMEVSSKLVEGNNTVVIVEMLDEIARGMEMIEKALTVKKLKAKGVKMLVNHKLTHVDGSQITVEGPDGIQLIDEVDNIVMTTGMKSYIPFDLEGKIPVYIIGDANKVQKAQDAIYDAYKLALSL